MENNLVSHSGLILNVVGNPSLKFISFHYSTGRIEKPEGNMCLMKISTNRNFLQCFSLADFYERADAELKQAFKREAHECMEAGIRSFSLITGPEMQSIKDMLRKDQNLIQVFELLVLPEDESKISYVLSLTQ